MRIDQDRVGETTLMYANRLVCESTCMRIDLYAKRPTSDSSGNMAVNLNFIYLHRNFVNRSFLLLNKSET